jgi:DNA-binding CsgD family transcriptional regulator
MTARELEELKRLYGEGLSAREVAARRGYCDRTVRRRLRAEGVLRSHLVAERERQEMARLYGRGLTLSEVGSHLNRAPTTVRVHLDRLGIPRRPRGETQRIHPRPRPRKCELESCDVVFVPEAAKVARAAGGRFCCWPHWSEWRTGRPQREWKAR